MTEDEWIKQVNKHDRHEQAARERLEYRYQLRQKPWITYFLEGKYDWKNHDLYLMNDRNVEVLSLTYSLRVYSHPEGFTSDVLVYTVQDIPPCGYFKIRDEDGEPIRCKGVGIHEVVWGDTRTWTGTRRAVEVAGFERRHYEDIDAVKLERVPELVKTVPPNSTDISHFLEPGGRQRRE